MGDAEWDRSKLPEPLSAGTWDFSGDPVLDSSPKSDPDELELSEPDVLPEALSDPELEPEEEELDLEPQDQWSGDGEWGENVMDYVVLVNQLCLDL